ncbi:oligosaccharide flippase family protein [Coprobacillaceae bacterium CR2/5/TPMF4]|nr:oligosaccharide flippase family protein [Coprobacillaceae bacterium CR2/5/TPMF4]
MDGSLLVSSLLDTGYNQLRSLVIGKRYSSNDLAYYNRGVQYPQLIVININTSISSVLFPAISEHQNELDIVKNMTRRAIKTSSFIMWPLMIGLSVIAKPLVELMLTEVWLLVYHIYKLLV